MIKGIGLLGLLLLLPLPVHSSECNPTYLLVPEIEAQVSEIWQVGFKAALIGCDEPIARMTDHERRVLGEELKNLLFEYGPLLEVALEDSQLRRELCQKINQQIGREVFFDLFGFSFTFAEGRPKD